MSLYRRGGKRLFDVCVAGASLVVLLPVLAATGLLVRLNLGKPVLFCQQRPGREGRLFTLFKFRSMLESADGDGDLLSDAERLTTFGARLRASSLDELPELWNVVKGDMSLIGPRPLLVEYLPLYSREQARRHQVRPGLTGLAQINGRNMASWEEKFAWDVWYVDHVSLGLDVRILWRTLTAVMRREGISADGEATAPPFTG